MKSPSSKKSCPKCGKKVFNITGHQKRDSKCLRLKTPKIRNIVVSPGSSTPLNFRKKKRKTHIQIRSPVSPGSSTPLNFRKKKIRFSKTPIQIRSPVSPGSSAPLNFRKKKSISSSNLLSQILLPPPSPIKRKLFPQLLISKIKSPSSRKKTCQICNKQVLNLKQHQKSKKCRNIAGLRKTKSPILKTKSPIRKTKSPIRKTVSPIRKTKSPIRKTVSPIRKTKSPSPSSRKKTCQICNKQVLNLKQHQKSKTCRRVAGLSSPKKKSRKQYGYIFNNIRPQTSQQNLDNFIIPYDESKCQDDCPICMSENDELNSIILKDCNHCFHLDCLRQWWNRSSKCPYCNRIYGFQVGNMPMGTMSAKLERHKLPGSIYDTIVIEYNFPAGVTTANQPNPGTPYPQDVRNCYLEASPEGYEVLDLLRRSFERGLTFTIGDSLTTGRRNVIIWNGVHHKTSIRGGSANYGFPDPGYYTRVKDELRAKGIF